MDKLQQIFIAEAQQLIADLELALLGFEKDSADQKSVQVIFRVMHTLKGSAGMFGFEALSKMTHDMESIYDAIRAGNITATPAIVEITLDMVDHLKILILDQHLTDPQVAQRHELLLKKIADVVASPTTPPSSTPSEANAIATYYIYCKPSPDIFKNGTNVLFLIDELSTLGKTIALPSLAQVPSFETLSENCYIEFEVVLTTDKSASDIQDVFIFVEDSCKVVIEKLTGSDLFLRSDVIDKIKEKSISTPALGINFFKSLLGDNHNSLTSTGASVLSTRSEVNSIRVASEKLDELMNLVSELVTSQARLSLTTEKFNSAELSNISETIEKITRRLRDNAFNICLVQIDTLALKFQRLVRDLSKDLKKEISLVTEGLETEIDRSIIEKVSDPILHILRNCIDHGIESPEERLLKQKPREGKIIFKAYHSGTHVHIEIRDDGKGIDIEKVKEKAIAKGLLAEGVELSAEAILNLIFLPGFSTADRVTDVSGRGVGMDIVKRNIESIHGEVSLTTSAGQGTTFSIKLPLTLSIMDGMLVEIGGSKYLLPLSSIDKCYEIESSKITTDVAQKHVFDGEMLSVFNLHHFFNAKTDPPKFSQVVKVDYDFPVGVTVDSIIGEYQAVMKPLSDHYTQYDEYSGATILGDGTVALVLDTTSLVKQILTKMN